jgi:plastocyanin
MKKYLLIISVLVLALSGGVAGYQLADGAQIPDAVSTNRRSTVALYTDRALPDALAIKVGETVSFSSADESSHSLSLGGGTHGVVEGSKADGHTHQHVGDFSSGQFARDEAWEATFSQPGTYEFHDHLHPDLRITVIVYAPGHL